MNLNERAADRKLSQPRQTETGSFQRDIVYES